ncbi:hypothetical protein [Paenibacillus sp.]|uniref:hypothetical protein n=1 Tax=Paenibacillus sp. TaxID=58172 RepID=UPI002D2F7F42|nr:hypothetical protein [Paenibacillus sp.]HZG83768.1 hypothetical protein [Paenibacillus sp.]
MRLIRAAVLWLMDVMVAVFIGPIERGRRAREVRKLAARRGVYAMVFAGVVALAATVYVIAWRWPSAVPY